MCGSDACVYCEVDGLPLTNHDLDHIRVMNAAAIKSWPAKPNGGGVLVQPLETARESRRERGHRLRHERELVEAAATRAVGSRFSLRATIVGAVHTHGGLGGKRGRRKGVGSADPKDYP